MAPPKTPDSQMLSSKDATLFRQLVRFYESKQYKKGIKSADQVRSVLHIVCHSGPTHPSKRLTCMLQTH